MAIVIKTNQLNTLIYKYLLQSGLSHTAYTMFNEAGIEQGLKEHQFYLKAGHLLSLLEKALVFTQIEAHTTFNGYVECNEPFELLTPHVCAISEKVKAEKDSLVTELNDKITESIKRTNNIYATELSNKNYNEIIYEAKSSAFLKNFHSIDIGAGKSSESDAAQQEYNCKSTLMSGLKGASESTIVVYKAEEKSAFLIDNDWEAFKSQITNIYPLFGGQNPLKYADCLHLTTSHVLVAGNFDRTGPNTLRVIERLGAQRQFDLKFDFASRIGEIESNSRFENLVALKAGNEYKVVNLNNQNAILQGSGLFTWRDQDEFVLLEDGQLKLKSLIKGESLMQFETSKCEYDHIETSPSSMYFLAVSKKNQIIHIFTAQNREPLYKFDFREDEERLIKAIWSERQGVDYLALLTDKHLSVWEVEMNCFCMKVQIEQFNQKKFYDVLSFCEIGKETVLLTISEDLILATDYLNQKNERIEISDQSDLFQNLSPEVIAIQTGQSLHFMRVKNLMPIFI